MSRDKAVRILRRLWNLEGKDFDLDWWRLEKLYSGYVDDWIARIQKTGGMR